ncbi:inositol-pentakisphosphate 2-kinase-like [Oscarella lobularis]|uniref:inositol-pentakisphosphate 2-kinase-like n=1 Tax=Oscarella lobularis TaxID=121494 RepID=UPI0033139822
MERGDLFRSSHWKYRGEGHSSLVLFHVDKPRVVLRLKKIDVVPGTVTSGKTREESMEYQRDFMQKVMRPLVGEPYVPVQQTVALPRGFIEKMSVDTEKERPRNRLVKGVKSGTDVALLMPDVCFLPESSLSSSFIKDERVVCQTQLEIEKTDLNRDGDVEETPIPTFCIEIKPKCGFLPPPYNSICKFCLFQRLKVKKGKWPYRSKYCPLDLFSGDVSRIKTALRCLLETPQNNLRIFHNGQCIFAEDKESSTPSQQLDDLKRVLRPYFPGENPIEGLITVLSQILTEPGSMDSSTSSPPVCEQSSHQFSVETPNQTIPCKLLAKLLGIQKYDDSGSPGTFPLYRKLRKECDAPPDDYIFWDLNDSPPRLRSSREDMEETAVSVLSQIERYLLAATAKDCSIMIAMRPQTNLRSLQKTVIFYDYSLAVVDLDLKGIWRVRKYFEEDQEILESFSNSV